MTEQADLAFVSTRFLFPIDSGGKIRSTQILKGLKGGDFRILLISPADPGECEEYADDLESVCDEFIHWSAPPRSRYFNYTRARYLLSELPIPVRTDFDRSAVEVIRHALARNPAIAVFDFLHAAVLMPADISCPTLLFTHNVEAEIFRRHRDVVTNSLMRWMWSSQYRKMAAFESAALQRFDRVVAVSARDSEAFETDYDCEHTNVIPTGVDLDFFDYVEPSRDDEVVFCGSMDWLANQEAMRHFLRDIWQGVVEEIPEARMTVVGRSPPESLVAEAERFGFQWTFTGFVDDVRPYMQGAAVSVIPLRVGGGTRLKAYESMSMGIPLVSTAVGMEGLPVTPGKHFCRADDAEAFAASVVTLLRDGTRRRQMARDARQFVEEHCSYRVAADVFQSACHSAIESHRKRTVAM